jgi:hypothetical protein
MKFEKLIRAGNIAAIKSFLENEKSGTITTN